MTNPADLMQEACDLLAQLMPRLRREIPVPDETAFAAPGMTGRPAAAPVPGNPPAFFAYTSIGSSARWAEELLLYALGASERDEPRGGADGVTLRLLTEVIPKLAAGVDDDTFGLVLRELGQRAEEARRVRAIDEAEQWRSVQTRACPFCGCFFLRVLIDARGSPTGRIECLGHTEAGAPCRSAWASLADIVPDLSRADELAGAVPDVEG